MKNDKVFCVDCGAVRIRGDHGLSVCPNGHGRLKANWNAREDLPTASASGYVRMGRRRRRFYHVIGQSNRYLLAGGVRDAEGRALAAGQVLAAVVYISNDSQTAIRRIRLLEPLIEP